ncbi:MAG: mechanosensitive ion channel family protein, partial [Pseudomonadales bacterium]
VITASLVILQSYGVSVGGVLAFGGIGGLAVGFAAQDLLANFFGALMIYMDKPFAVGDWVRSPDREIEGTVEDIGWRRTLIRTFDKRALYVPNSVFNKISLENPSRMTNRRIYETVGVRYSDIGAVENIVTRAKEMLLSHEDIDTDLIIMVNLNKFGASSVDFFIYCYTKTTNWAEYHEIKQDVLFKVERIIDEENAEIAYPTQTLHVEPLEVLEARMNQNAESK